MPCLHLHVGLSASFFLERQELKPQCWIRGCIMMGASSDDNAPFSTCSTSYRNHPRSNEDSWPALPSPGTVLSPARAPSRSGSCEFVTLIDDCSCGLFRFGITANASVTGDKKDCHSMASDLHLENGIGNLVYHFSSTSYPLSLLEGRQRLSTRRHDAGMRHLSRCLSRMFESVQYSC